MCDAGAHECHVNALCVVSASNRGYDCVCKAGLEGNGNALWSRNDGFFDTIAMGQSLGGNTSCNIRLGPYKYLLIDLDVNLGQD